MTVGELIKYLQTLPKDAVVMRQGDEYNGDVRYCTSTTYRKESGFGVVGNSVLIN